jgi:SLOG in TRPM, prokaryote
MENPFRILFPNKSVADVLRVHTSTEITTALQELGLQKGHRVLVVIGGASRLSAEDFDRVRLIFSDVLAPLVKKWGAYVVDGGTDAGVMRLMGQARAENNSLFPLIGICPIGLAIVPGETGLSEEAADLEPNHSHFLLVPGSHWGDESPWIAKVASELADGNPSVTVLINGGEVTWKDASQNAQQGRSIIVIAGSGRTADQLAAVLRGEATDQRAQEIIDSGLVQAIDLTAGHEELTKTIEKIFAAAE